MDVDAKDRAQSVPERAKEHVRRPATRHLNVKIRTEVGDFDRETFATLSAAEDVRVNAIVASPVAATQRLALVEDRAVHDLHLDFVACTPPYIVVVGAFEPERVVAQRFATHRCVRSGVVVVVVVVAAAADFLQKGKKENGQLIKNSNYSKGKRNAASNSNFRAINHISA